MFLNKARDGAGLECITTLWLVLLYCEGRCAKLTMHVTPFIQESNNVCSCTVMLPPSIFYLCR